MANHDFILKSGAKLHITTAPFENAVNLVEVVKRVSAGMDKSLDIADAALASPDVRKAIYEVFPWATYDSLKLYPGLFDEPKIGERARGDYFEICSRLIEVNARPFFLTISSGSTDLPKAPIESPEQP